jgi:hypothetical protein
VELAHIRGLKRNWEGVLEALEGFDTPSLAYGQLNRVMAHLHLGQADQAQTASDQAIRDTLCFTPFFPVSPVLALGLAAHPFWPEELWSTALAQVDHIHDPGIAQAVQETIKRWPAGRRRDALSARCS